MQPVIGYVTQLPLILQLHQFHQSCFLHTDLNPIQVLFQYLYCPIYKVRNIIVKYKTLNYIFSYTFNLFPTLGFTSTLYYINSLTLSIVFNKMSLSFILYINSFLILFVLLWSLLKCLLLLRSLVWPLLLKLLVLLPLEFLTSQLP